MRKSFPLLILIILLATYLRFNNLKNNPPGFYADEASVGYNAYTIYTSARDEHNNFLPVFFKAYGEYKNPFAIYPVVPFIALFGPNEAAIRSTQAIFGILDIILIFFLGRVLWNNAVGLLSSFVMAISPWHIHISRFIIESHNAFLLFIIAGSLFLILAKKYKWKNNYVIITSICFGLSFYTYFATRIFTPLFLLGLLFFWRKWLIALIKKKPKRVLLGSMLFLLIVTPYILHLVSGQGLIRFNSVSFTKKHNNLLSDSVSLYLKHFEPKFVFILGDSDYPGQQTVRHSINGIGLFYKWQLPFFILGLGFLISANKEKYDAKIVILLMLLLYPLGTVISDAITPYATRSVIGILPYSLLIALGIYKTYDVIKNKPLKMILAAAIIFASTFYLNRFLMLSKAYLNRAYGYAGFQYGAREVIEYFMKTEAIYPIKILDGGFDGKQAYIDFYSLGKCNSCHAGDPKPADQQVQKLIAVSVDNLTAFKEKYTGEVIHKIHYPNMQEAIYLYEAYSKK